MQASVTACDVQDDLQVLVYETSYEELLAKRVLLIDYSFVGKELQGTKPVEPSRPLDW